MSERTITVIPATNAGSLPQIQSIARKKRVAAYARVSTDKEEQQNSYEAQVDYYTDYIQKNPEWAFIEVYADEGITGTSTKKREGFNRMITDALAGKIDLILTKSVSRFARNTVDSLTTVRQLKEKGVEVYFEKENIYTLDSKGELLITIMSFLAQEESRSISENVTWGQRKRFADGKVSFAYSRFLGYSRGEDGIPQIIEEEAEIVRRIYRLFISGKTACSIARLLTKEGIPTPSGKQNWSVSTVESILRNEKYKGSALLQKKFTVDFLAKKMKVNEGEVPQYFVEHSHEPIIDPEEFERVQVEFTRRKAMGRSYSSSGVFASKIVCGDCGGFYGSKVWHSTDKYRRTIWQCNAKFKGEHKCTTPHLDEEDIKSRFVKAINTIEKDKEALLESCEQIKTLYTDCTEIDDTMRALRQEIEVVTGITRAYIEENTRAAQNQDEFRKRYNELEKRYEKAVDRYNALEQKRAQRMARVGTFDTFIKAFKELDGTVFSFDKRLWQTLLDHVTVRADGVLVFCFNNGTEIEA